MSDFTSVYPETSVLDPHKRVNYIHGLVLGVDEFKQEEFYQLEQNRLHNRALHGYGTVCGLRVNQREISSGVEITVEPGMAVCPNGQVVQVPRTQCAILDEWLSSHSDEISSLLGSPATGSLSIYLMLCFRECKTDVVPIPTGPCQSLDESTAPSRIADDFSLSFELDVPPASHFYSPIQVLQDLLQNIPVEVGGAMTLEELKALVRSLLPGNESPPIDSPPISSPPVSSPEISAAIAPENTQAFFNAAFLVWVTEVKPCLLANTMETVPDDPFQRCVFLAQLNFDVVHEEGVTRIDPLVDIEINEQNRQYILNTQSLQHSNTFASFASTMALISNNSSPSVETAPSEFTDESQLLHIHGDETILGSKTFNAPIRLALNGRVTKKITLPAYQAHHGRGAARGLFSNTLPAMHFLTTGSNAFSGEAIFSIPIPDDILFERGMQFQLVWGFQGQLEPASIEFEWRVGAQFFELNDSVSGNLMEFVNVTVSEPTQRRNDVLVTHTQSFDSNININQRHRYGVMHVSMLDPGVPISQVYLLQVELIYTADRLGRSV